LILCIKRKELGDRSQESEDYKIEHFPLTHDPLPLTLSAYY